MNPTEPRLVVNPRLSVAELLDELAARLQQLYGSLDTLAVRADSEGAELMYDALWALLEDVYQIQSLRDALQEQVGGGEAAGDPAGVFGTQH